MPPTRYQKEWLWCHRADFSPQTYLDTWVVYLDLAWLVSMDAEKKQQNKLVLYVEPGKFIVGGLERENICQNTPEHEQQHEEKTYLAHRIWCSCSNLDENLPHDNHDLQGLEGDGSKYPATEAPGVPFFQLLGRNQILNNRDNRTG